MTLKCHRVIRLQTLVFLHVGMTRFCRQWSLYMSIDVDHARVPQFVLFISEKVRTSLCYPPQPLASADNTNHGIDDSRYHAQPHPIIVNYCNVSTYL